MSVFGAFSLQYSYKVHYTLNLFTLPILYPEHVKDC